VAGLQLLSKLSGKGAGRPSAGVGEAVQGELAAALDPVALGVDVWVRDHGFEVTGDATVDDPLPTPSGSGNQRTLRDLPSVVTPDLDERIAVLPDTQRNCARTPRCWMISKCPERTTRLVVARDPTRCR
jgi:hypothetical protein